MLVDLDAQANATLGIGIKYQQLEHALYDALTGGCPLEDVICPTVFEGLHLLPSSADLAALDVYLAGLENREYSLKTCLAPLESYYDYILIDCPPSLNLATVNALVFATDVLIPVQCEFYAMEGMTKLLKTVQLIRQSLNPGLHILGILMSMYDRRLSLHRQVVADVREHFQSLVFETLIPRNVRLAEAPSHGMPIQLYNRNSKGALSYAQLTKELMSRYETVR